MKRILVAFILLGGSFITVTSAEVTSAFVCTITGTPGNDFILRGTDATDVICGLGGHDVISAMGGNDIIYGGAGNDVIYGGAGLDRIFGGAGHDEIEGGDGPDVIKGGDGNDALYGNDEINVIYGGAGSDVIVGGWKRDALRGGTGRDLIHGDAGDDELYGEDGSDWLDGEEGNDSADGGPGTNACDFRETERRQLCTNLTGSNEIISMAFESSVLDVSVADKLQVMQLRIGNQVSGIFSVYVQGVGENHGQTFELALLNPAQCTSLEGTRPEIPISCRTFGNVFQGRYRQEFDVENTLYTDRYVVTDVQVYDHRDRFAIEYDRDDLIAMGINAGFDVVNNCVGPSANLRHRPTGC